MAAVAQPGQPGEQGGVQSGADGTGPGTTGAPGANAPGGTGTAGTGPTNLGDEPARQALAQGDVIEPDTTLTDQQQGVIVEGEE